jgi:hypothetical protein
MRISQPSIPSRSRLLARIYCTNSDHFKSTASLPIHHEACISRPRCFPSSRIRAVWLRYRSAVLLRHRVFAVPTHTLIRGPYAR